MLGQFYQRHKNSISFSALFVLLFLVVVRNVYRVATIYQLPKIQFLRPIHFGIRETLEVYILYFAVAVSVCLIFWLIYKQFKQEVDHSRHLGLYLLLGVHFFIPFTFYSMVGISSVLIYVWANHVLKDKKLPVIIGIIFVILVNGGALYLMYEKRINYFPPQHDDALAHLEYIGRISDSFNDQSFAVQKLQEDVKEDLHDYKFTRYHIARYLIQTNTYYLWSLIYGLPYRFVNISPERYFLITQIIGFIYFCGVCYFLMRWIARKFPYSDKGLALFLIGLMTLVPDPWIFIDMKPFSVTVMLFLVIVFCMAFQKIQWALILIPLHIISHPSHIYDIPYFLMVGGMAYFLPKVFKNNPYVKNDFKYKDILWVVLTLILSYIVLTLFHRWGILPQILFSPTETAIIVSNQTIMNWADFHIFEEVSRRLKTFFDIFVYRFSSVTLAWNPVFLYVWYLSIRYLFKQESSEHKNLLFFYLAYIVLILIAIFVHEGTVIYLVNILQVFNFIIIYFYVSQKNNAVKGIALILAFVMVCITPKIVRAMDYSRMWNFYNPFPEQLHAKLKSESIIFHSNYKYSVAHFLAYPEYLDDRHVLFYQWLRNDIDLSGYDINASVLLGFDGKDEFIRQITSYKGLIDYKLVSTRHVNSRGFLEEKKVISSAVFQRGNQRYAIKRIQNRWPYSLYRLYRIGR